LRNFAIFGRKAADSPGPRDVVQTVTLDDVTVHCGIVHTPEPEFLPDAPEYLNSVLVRVRAFSLNYRDKALIFKMALKGTETAYFVVGSEFAGEVVAVGRGVTTRRPGDRVMSDHAYPETRLPGIKPGVASNHSSREFLVLHEGKLARMPDNMTYACGAAFSIGAQTTYSMVRRLDVREGMNVLVTSAKSNTSLFAINALRGRGVNLYATSTSHRFEAELRSMGVKELCVLDTRKVRFASHAVLAEVAMNGGFHCVIDPYFDLHLSPSIEVMAVGGKYITCGLYDQYLDFIGKELPGAARTGQELPLVVIRNLQVIGNCIGLPADLDNAAADYAAGKLPVVIDSTFSGSCAGAFLDRTYNAPERFGKVVFEYQ
jgi:NADPH:quinone reductase-like Zn-dependent oxidoreductase